MFAFLLPAMIVAHHPSTEIRGKYVEARTCDVFAGSCFANADTGLTGKTAVLAWKVESGVADGIKLNGLGVAAVVVARETLGLKQSAPGRALLYVDDRATSGQRDALVAFAKAQAKAIIGDVVDVKPVKFDLTICNCDGEGCATFKAGDVKVTTRCIDAEHDRACANETTLYTPLAAGVSAKAAMATEHSYTGKDLNETWNDRGRRGAFVGSFATH
jgi:hypothetical protein